MEEKEEANLPLKSYFSNTLDHLYSGQYGDRLVPCEPLLSKATECILIFCK